MPRADAASSAKGNDKKSAYNYRLGVMEGLMADQGNWVCNLANASSILWHMYHSLKPPSSNVNWAGFYVLDRKDRTKLILGPFHGKVACQVIKLGKGVCGTSASEGKTIMSNDVHDFPSHIACDKESKSEIVVPIFSGEKVVGVIDIDCTDLNGFDDTDKEGLEAMAAWLGECCDWTELLT